MGNSSSSKGNATVINMPADLTLPSTIDEEDDHCECCGDEDGGIFRGFCPPPKNRNSRYSRWSDDPIGTPMQETPPNIRKMRTQMEKMGLMSSRYQGLEKEATFPSRQKSSGSSGGTASSSGKFGALSPPSDFKKSPSAQIHQGQVSS